MSRYYAPILADILDDLHGQEAEPTPISLGDRVDKFLDNHPDYKILYSLPSGKLADFEVYHGGNNEIMFKWNNSFFQKDHSYYIPLINLFTKDLCAWEAKDSSVQKNKLLSESDFFRIKKFIETNQSYFIPYQPEPLRELKTSGIHNVLNFTVCLHDAVRKIRFQSKSPFLEFYEGQSEFDVLLATLMVAVNDWEAKNAIAEINQQYDHGFAPRLSDLELENNDLKKAIAELNSKVENLLGQNGENPIAVQPENTTSTTFVVHLTHCDRAYEAFWRENYGSFYTCEVGSDGELGFVGHVEVEKDQSWTNEIFLSVSKTIISAYLKGLQSYHNNRF
jgi:hypothetical protein